MARCPRMASRRRFARREDLGLTRAEFAVLRRLNTPRKIQAFLYGLRQNFEPQGDTCHGVREVLRTRRAHCIEGAMLAAADLRAANLSRANLIGADLRGADLRGTVLTESLMDRTLSGELAKTGLRTRS